MDELWHALNEAKGRGSPERRSPLFKTGTIA